MGASRRYAPTRVSWGCGVGRLVTAQRYPAGRGMIRRRGRVGPTMTHNSDDLDDS
jgi:hypothetical protein